MSYTLGEAAKAVGKSKPTIQRAIKSGKISALKNDNGSYTIEASELHRVFPVKQSNSDNGSIMKQNVTANNNSEVQAEINTIKRELDISKQERERERLLLEQQIEIYKDRLDRADKDKDMLTALLNDQTEKPAKRFFDKFLK